MQENNEIKALLRLIDDPDEQVYMAVSEKIISYGTDIIPNLESMWESIHNDAAQERIEQLIHFVYFSSLTVEFEKWLNQPYRLLDGAILLAKYHYPELSIPSIHQELEKIKKNIWLELNNYLTPMEQIGVFNSILYNYCKLSHKELSHEHPGDFLISKTLEAKSGNKYGNGTLYLILSEMLDIPVQAIGIPNQFILAYQSEKNSFSEFGSNPVNSNLFFIDPASGQMYSSKDVENYLKVNLPDYPLHQFTPLSNIAVIKVLLKEIRKCYDSEQNEYKSNELQQWIQKIESLD